MATDKSNDVLMMFKGPSGLIDGEAQSTIDPSKDPLMRDFVAGKFLQIEDFKIGFEVEDEEPEKKGIGGSGASTPAGSVSGAKFKFSKWRSATPGSTVSIPYPIQMDPFSFTRTLGKASMFFFDYCVNSISFKSAVLVKRKVVGHHNIDNTKIVDNALSGLQAYFRVDFTDVLLTDLDWDDGETIKETAKFVCRKIQIQYRQQNPDGTLKKAPAAVSFDYQAATLASQQASGQ
jgi:type VI protein secretion system component Hcp